MSGLTVEIDSRGITSLVDMFGATEKQLQAAMRSTYAKMGRWLRTQSVRGLTKKLRIQQKILRSRVRSYRMQNGVGGDGAGAKVWYGLRGIPLSRLKPRETAKGVKTAGGRFVEGAFIARVHGSLQVLKREGKSRLPIRIQYAEIADESITYIEDHLVGTALFDAQFYKFLEHELRWRTQILK
ncbi:MAG TPA: hypothetical protein VJM50_23840 [Pyrinomonadaceae bacterium]|nr:hypothetical protein [Pyrinomonadaceae bacterium]